MRETGFGAFTGAMSRRKGVFELADGGTVFLDEVGEMPIHVQTRMLRVLQKKRVRRVGGSQSINIDIRVIAATHQNLDDIMQRKVSLGPLVPSWCFFDSDTAFFWWCRREDSNLHGSTPTSP